ncbi:MULTISPECIES: HigA family addiction module antitoxin [Kistimonas]|uniref:HigA family addiction module antitoxin n=1 Tax=Kistimonas scapharcae TaxID=1036133 RepID=A0ABP8V1G4_9GAMM|nr:HigA family addiction module antitoxin [Kistimonas asteriae]
MQMSEPLHPGEILKIGYLDPLGLSVTEAAKRLDVSRKTVSEIINGRCGISVEMALRLAKACSTTPDFWLNIQRSFDLWANRGFDSSNVIMFSGSVNG